MTDDRQRPGARNGVLDAETIELLRVAMTKTVQAACKGQDGTVTVVEDINTLCRMALRSTASETAPLHAGYADDDEYWGVTIEDYVNQHLETDAEEWVVGFEFHVDHVYSRTEKWRVASGPTMENPDAPIKVEKLAAAPQTAEDSDG